MAFLTKTLTVTSGSDLSPVVDFTDWVDWDGTELAMAANVGDGTASTILFRDEDGVIQDYVGSGKFLLGHNVVKVTVGSNTLYRGRIADIDTFRGRQVAFRTHEISVTGEDYNSDLDGIAVHEFVRNEETDKARVQGLLAAYLSGSPRITTNLNGSNYVSSSNTQTLAAKTYTQMTPRDVLREIAEDVDKNFFVTVDGELFWDGNDSAAYLSSLRISDDLADTVLSPNTFFPWDPHGKRFVREQMSALRSYYGSGSGDAETPTVRVTNDIHTRLDYWEGIWNDSAAFSEERATNRATRRLAYFARDEATYTCAIGPMTGDDIYKIKAGQTIQFKSKAARGGRLADGAYLGSVFRTVRVNEIRWTFPTVDSYIAHLSLDRPQTLGLPRGTLPPRPAPECAPDTPAAPIYTWNFNSDEFDTTATYDSGLNHGVPGPDCPNPASACGWNTASSGPATLFPVVAGTSYTVSMDIKWKYDPSIRDILVRWYNAATAQISFVTVIDGSGHSSNVAYAEAATVTAPTGAAFATITYSSFAGVFVDNVVWGTPPVAASGNDEFCLTDPGTSPYYARSDDPRFTRDDQHLITRLSGRHINSSAVNLEQGDVVVADLVDEGAVTTTTTAEYTAGMVGVVLEGGNVGAEVIVGWQGRFSFVNLDAIATAGDTITTSSSATAGTPVTGRTEGSVGRVLAVDASDAPTIVEWWGVPDSAVGSGSGSYVLNTLGGKEVVHAHGNTGTTETIDLANGNWHTVTLDANCTFTFTGATTGTGCSFRLRVHQDATGSRMATWPGSVVWPAATAPTLSTAANAVDLLAFESNDGGTIWYGSYLSGGGGGSYTDEQAQDAVGTILVDTATVDLTYTDATPSITAAVIPGGIKLDDLGTPDDNTDLNASTSRHGLLKKLDNSVTNFMNGQGDWSAPGVSSAGLNGGTSFPGSPGTNDLFFRTDRDLIYYYDGTRWLTAAQYPIPLTSPLTITGTTTSGTEFSRTGVIYKTVYSLWLDTVEYATYVSTTNNGSQFWTVTCNRVTDAAAATSLGNFTTAADTASRFTRHTIAIGAVVDSTAVIVNLVATKTSTPGAFFPSDGVLMTRLVG